MLCVVPSLVTDSALLERKSLWPSTLRLCARTQDVWNQNAWIPHMSTSCVLFLKNSTQREDAMKCQFGPLWEAWGGAIPIDTNSDDIPDAFNEADKARTSFPLVLLPESCDIGPADDGNVPVDSRTNLIYIYIYIYTTGSAADWARFWLELVQKLKTEDSFMFLVGTRLSPATGDQGTLRPVYRPVHHDPDPRKYVRFWVRTCRWQIDGVPVTYAEWLAPFSNITFAVRQSAAKRCQWTSDSDFYIEIDLTSITETSLHLAAIMP